MCTRIFQTVPVMCAVTSVAMAQQCTPTPACGCKRPVTTSAVGSPCRMLPSTLDRHGCLPGRQHRVWSLVFGPMAYQRWCQYADRLGYTLAPTTIGLTSNFAGC
jgi:hypothetical protein